MVFLTGRGPASAAPADVPPPPSRGQALAVVLKEGDVVDCRLDAAHAAVLVVHLDRGTGEAVFDAGPLDASGKLRTDLLGQLRADLTAEKVGDLLRLDAQRLTENELSNFSRLWHGG